MKNNFHINDLKHSLIYRGIIFHFQKYDNWFMCLAIADGFVYTKFNIIKGKKNKFSVINKLPELLNLYVIKHYTLGQIEESQNSQLKELKTAITYSKYVLPQILDVEIFTNRGHKKIKFVYYKYKGTKKTIKTIKTTYFDERKIINKRLEKIENT